MDCLFELTNQFFLRWFTIIEMISDLFNRHMWIVLVVFTLENLT